ncbi:MAG: hypothetical protein R6U46_06140 [Marinilabilia sp.]
MSHSDKRGFLTLTFLVGLTIFASAQYPYTTGRNDTVFNEEHAHQLFFDIENTNFVKNNEYETPLMQGYTLIGYGLQPALTYFAGRRLRLRAGVFLQQYSGLDHYNLIRPVLSAHLKLSPSVDLIMGSLRGHVHHRLIEPLFDPERQYTRPVENGLQFLVERPWLWLDAWIDWEQFIRQGDDYPEKFTAGLSAHPELLETSGSWQVSLPVNMIAVHRGGEISDYPRPVQTSLNVAAGTRVEHTSGGVVHKTGLFGYRLTYRNINEVGPMDVNTGDAWYVGAVAESGRFNYLAGYFRGNDFVALRGSGLFQSVSPVREGLYVPRRELLTGKAGYHRTFMKKIEFSFLLEGYYDVPNENFDFAAGLQVSFSPEFFLTEAEFF